MKLKDKISLIKNELSKEIKPIDTKSILTSAHIEEVPTYTYKPRIMFLRPLINICLLLITIIPLSIVLLTTQTDNTDEYIDDPYDNFPIHSNVNLYGFVTANLISLIYSTDEIYNNISNTTITDNLLVLNQLNKVNQLLPQVDMILMLDQHTFISQKSEKSNYPYKLIYQGYNLNDEEITYNIYINEGSKENNKSNFLVLVEIGEKSYEIVGLNEVEESKNIVKLTYFPYENDDVSYLQVETDISQENLKIKIVKNNTIIIDALLKYVKANNPYVILTTSSNNNISTFNIYPSSNGKFTIDYIVLDKVLDENNLPEIENKETGNISVSIGMDENNFFIESNHCSDSISIKITNVRP